MLPPGPRSLFAYTLNLRYYDIDSSASEQEHFCMIHLLQIDYTSPMVPINDIVRLKNLPTAPLIHVLIDHLRTTGMSPTTPLENLLLIVQLTGQREFVA